MGTMGKAPTRRLMPRPEKSPVLPPHEPPRARPRQPALAPSHTRRPRSHVAATRARIARPS